jgi:hypothetical protein
VWKLWRKEEYFASCRETNPDISVIQPGASLLFPMSYVANKINKILPTIMLAEAVRLLICIQDVCGWTLAQNISYLD